jgi:hypothetical protein
VLDSLRKHTTRSIFNLFSDIDVVSILLPGCVSSQSQFMLLKDWLMSATDQVQTCKLDAGWLFSGTHLSALFRYASDYFTTTFNKLFDFIKTS